MGCYENVEDQNIQIWKMERLRMMAESQQKTEGEPEKKNADR